MLKKKQHAKQNEEPEPELPELKSVEEPVVELKKVEKVGGAFGNQIYPSCIEIMPQKVYIVSKGIWKICCLNLRLNSNFYLVNFCFLIS